MKKRPANKPRPVSSKTPNLTPKTEFAAVDLDIRSRRSLAPLLKAWPWAQTPGQEPGKVPRWLLIHSGGRAETADGAVGDLITLVDRLSPSAKRCWRSASARTFDVGIQSGLQPYAFEGVELKPDTIRNIARVGGRVLVTLYAPRAE